MMSENEYCKDRWDGLKKIFIISFNWSFASGKNVDKLSLVEQELLTLPEHLSSLPVFSWVRVTRSIVLYVCFADCHLSFCSFSYFFLLANVLSVLQFTPLVSSNSSCPVYIFVYLDLYEKFEYTIGVIRSCKFKNKQYNSEKKNDNDQPTTTQKTKEWATRTPLKNEVNSGAPER